MVLLGMNGDGIHKRMRTCKSHARAHLKDTRKRVLIDEFNGAVNSTLYDVIKDNGGNDDEDDEDEDDEDDDDDAYNDIVYDNKSYDDDNYNNDADDKKITHLKQKA